MLLSDPESINCRNVLADRKIVPDEQIKLFCNILFIHGDKGENLTDDYGRKCYINRIRPLLTKLRFPLAKPHSVVRKLLLPEQLKYAYLCDVHSGLNADFVHQWFKYLALEVGARLEMLRSSDREHVGTCAWDTIIKPLTRLHKIWLSPEQVREAFGDFVETDFDPQYDLVDATRQIDGCEACILARIGTHINTVWALHTVIRSRITLESHAKHPSRLRLLRLIDPWIEHWQDRYSTKSEVIRLNQREASTALSEELYEVREEIKVEQHRLRRAQRKVLDARFSGSQKYKKLVKDLDDKTIEDYIYDAENDIVDHYAVLRATQRASALIVAGNIDPESGSAGHPKSPRYKFESKASLQSASVTRQGQPSLYAPRSHMDKAYLESRYSINTLRNNDGALLGRGAALDDLNTHAAGLHLSTQYSPVHPSEMAGFSATYPAAGSHDTTCTTWPVHWNGSRVELGPLQTERNFVDTTISKPLAQRAAKSCARPVHQKKNQGRHRVAPARSVTHKNKSGKYTSSASSHQLTEENLQAHATSIKPDFDCLSYDRDGESRCIDIPISDDGHGGSEFGRSSTFNPASGHSGYYKHNGARGYATQPSNLRFEARLPRPMG